VKREILGLTMILPKSAPRDCVAPLAMILSKTVFELVDIYSNDINDNIISQVISGSE